MTPSGQVFGHCDVANELTACFIVGFLQRQGFVVYEAAAACISAHVALLLAVRHQFILEGLEALHRPQIIICSMTGHNEIRPRWRLHF